MSTNIGYAVVPSNMTLKIRSILMGYMRHDVHVENLLNIRRSYRNLAKMGLTEKNKYDLIWKNIMCAVSLANRLRAVADAFRPLRTHQRY